ncbi:hypothetical protein P9216_23545, partial [Bacillus licheniformis]|uniref:hypothetical protein n=3 Tax=Bacillus TaxID=1386 RepID=UPI002E1CFC62|nr:hypothetical protein [Bacillus licheniformis]
HKLIDSTISLKMYLSKCNMANTKMKRMIIMFKCDLCNVTVGNKKAFVGTKNEKKMHSCFECFLKTIKPFTFDEELVYYPLIGIREIKIDDSVVFYDIEGKELAKIYLNSYEEGFLSFLKEEIAEDTGLCPEQITLVIEPYDVQMKYEI